MGHARSRRLCATQFSLCSDRNRRKGSGATVSLRKRNSGQWFVISLRFLIKSEQTWQVAAADGRAYSPAVRLTKLTMSDEGGACSTRSDVLERSGDSHSSMISSLLSWTYLTPVSPYRCVRVRACACVCMRVCVCMRALTLLTAGA